MWLRQNVTNSLPVAIQLVPPLALITRFHGPEPSSEMELSLSILGRGSALDPAGGAYDVPPDSLVGWGGNTPPIPHPTRHRPNFGARHAFPQKSRQIYAYGPHRVTKSRLGWMVVLVAITRLRRRVGVR